jgi:hypothetical protein
MPANGQIITWTVRAASPASKRSAENVSPGDRHQTLNRLTPVVTYDASLSPGNSVGTISIAGPATIIGSLVVETSASTSELAVVMGNVMLGSGSSLVLPASNVYNDTSV